MSNRLAGATSPYLLQHADNPVDWYEWGDEAFGRALAEDKPILLSIGYSACHWCHVMAHESFEDPQTAAVMNDLFVNIKVDREERPDVDDVYMAATQAMTGRGGWPMTVFLTPERKPFYAGTYFPPDDRHGMPGFRRVLEAVDAAWRERREDVTLQADRLAGAISRDVAAGGPAPDDAFLPAAYSAIAAGADRVNGGFGEAPKFPQAPVLEFMLRVMHEPWAGSARAILTETLTAMANGGIYDQVGGGFARYATDAAWLVPHFEKMLYDNALLARLYLRAWQETGIDRFREVATGTLDYLMRDMALPGGGFCSAEDADSEGREGLFYLWDAGEFARLAGDHAGVAGEVLGVEAAGNFEGLNILHLARSTGEVAERRGLDVGEVEAALQATRRALLEARGERIRPGRDDKVICGWNGLTVRALAEAGAVLGNDGYLAAARRTAAFLLQALRRPDGRLLRSGRDGVARVPAFLEDYAALGVGLFTLYQATGEAVWYREGRALLDAMLDLFWDGRAFYATGHDAETLIARPRDLMDNPAPSGTALAAEAILMAAHWSADPALFDLLDRLFASGGMLMRGHPSAVGHLLAVFHTARSGLREVAVVGAGDDPRTAALRAVVWERFRPGVVLAVGNGGSSDGIPLLENRAAGATGPLAYVCERFVCNAPVGDPEALRAALA